jgi:hypothetical protein
MSENNPNRVIDTLLSQYDTHPVMTYNSTNNIMVFNNTAHIFRLLALRRWLSTLKHRSNQQRRLDFSMTHNLRRSPFRTALQHSTYQCWRCMEQCKQPM